MPNYLAAFANAHEAESAAGELLDGGVSVDGISLIVGDEYASRILSLDENTAPLYLENDLTASPAGDDSVDVTNVRDPMTTPSYVKSVQSDFFESPEPILHESPIGGGISTATPDDSVSGIEEMDDGQAVAEDLLYPGGPVDSRELEMADIDSDPEFVSSTGMIDSTLGKKSGGAIMGPELGTAAGALAALNAFDIPDVGVVFGEGDLATSVADAGETPVAGGILGYLEQAGVPQEFALRCTASFERGGAILEVRAPAGDLEEEDVQTILTRNGAREIRALDLAVY